MRVLSRGLRSRSPSADATYVVGDVRTGEGLADAIAGVEPSCTASTRHAMLSTQRLGPEARTWSSFRLSEWNRAPLGYYRRKLADEQLISTSGLPWTVLRATQFHDVVAALLGILAIPPIMIVPAG